MTGFKRYAVYYAPPPGAFADLAAAWLGWDPEAGQPVSQPDLGLPASAITDDPRRYGFHGTLKPPFRLADGVDLADLQSALHRLAEGLAPVTMPGLRLASLDGFLALIPEGDANPLKALAAEVVSRLDPLRAPLTEPEIARRKPERLTPHQRALLDQWGYPYVMDEFRFHLTLTNRLDPQMADQAIPVLSDHFAPVLPRPFTVAELCLFGEPQDGPFRLIQRCPLAG